MLIVYGLFLVIVGVTTTAQTVLVSAHFSNAALNEIIGSDAATIRSFANLNLLETDLSGPVAPTRSAALSRGLESLVRNGTLLHLEIRRPDGTVVASDDRSLVATVAPLSSDFAVAVGGSIVPTFVETSASSETPTALGQPSLLREYLPITVDDRVRAVVGVWRDATPVLRAMDDVRREVVIVTVTGALVAAVLLFLVFRAAQNRITRQTIELVEATRQDPLTGLANHGGLLAALAARIETGRQAPEPIGVALVDVDGFRLLNDTYGHEAGDLVLQRVAARLVREFADDAVIGRYGPDEFLVVVDGERAATLEHALDWLRAALADEALEFDDSERLPITVSAGISIYPTDASSVTALLASAVQALGEAKASGGDAVRVAGRVPVLPADAKAFDIFQGLILAVDAKDRYTKRHCEDVARYSVFLARRLGLEEDVIRSIRVAGLLHDLGKIGIPDALLRKPGRLTADEFDIVKQHVALGDLILRDLPSIELIRSGVRHHHERWDGRGYLDELAGEDIPLVARILAVGDAFSAMTTTRPYRKSLAVDEALRRLEDAAGTQLEERLVRTFVDAMRTEPDAPVPGLPEAAARQLWTPFGRVA
jgi:diguanylate cyclase (GGDEF)-like protein